MQSADRVYCRMFSAVIRLLFDMLVSQDILDYITTRRGYKTVSESYTRIPIHKQYWATKLKRENWQSRQICLTRSVDSSNLM